MRSGASQNTEAGSQDSLPARRRLAKRSKGYAFGLPLFQREQFLGQLRMVERLRAIAGGHDKSVAQLAISWVLGNPAVAVALVGIRRTEELKENVAVVEWRLSPDERQEIDTIFAE